MSFWGTSCRNSSLNQWSLFVLVCVWYAVCGRITSEERGLVWTAASPLFHSILTRGMVGCYSEDGRVIIQVKGDRLSVGRSPFICWQKWMDSAYYGGWILFSHKLQPERQKAGFPNKQACFFDCIELNSCTRWPLCGVMIARQSNRDTTSRRKSRTRSPALSFCPARPHKNSPAFCAILQKATLHYPYKCIRKES